MVLIKERTMALEGAAATAGDRTRTALVEGSRVMLTEPKSLMGREVGEVGEGSEQVEREREGGIGFVCKREITYVNLNP